jgi:hypothetical protein
MAKTFEDYMLERQMNVSSNTLADVVSVGKYKLILTTNDRSFADPSLMKLGSYLLKLVDDKLDRSVVVAHSNNIKVVSDKLTSVYRAGINASDSLDGTVNNLQAYFYRLEHRL